MTVSLRPLSFLLLLCVSGLPGGMPGLPRIQPGPDVRLPDILIPAPGAVGFTGC